MAKVHDLGLEPIADHSFSSDGSLLVIARNNNAELYFDTGKSKLELGITFTDHDKTVTSVDVAPQSGRVVTCSQDRNALVWEPQPDGTWKPTLVLLRINRAATSVRWSPNESKFAVGSGSRVIAVCYFEEENDWWVSKHVKKPIRSTILSVDWHPNSVLLAGGSTDGHARVFSGFVKGLDAKPAPSVWGERLPFQTLCGDYTSTTGSWVHAVKFSPSGDSLAFTTHDSVVIAYPQGPEQPPQALIEVNTSFLPFRSLTWTDENTVVAAGNDFHPVVFKGDANGWQFSHSIDDPKKSKKSGNIKEDSALNMFRKLDTTGEVNESRDISLPTIHQNTITAIRPFAYSGNKVTKVSTSGLDGKVVIFDV